jgi:PPOX class probable F420-dependent enzyme
MREGHSQLRRPVTHHESVCAMPVDLDQQTVEFILQHRVARLATVDAEAQPMVVPVCYAFDGRRFYTPIDEKPKSVAAGDLKRVRNIKTNSRVALVIDDYSEDWSELAYVLVSGRAELIWPAASDSEHARAVTLLREKYPQYRSMAIDQRPIIKITPRRFKRWTAAA